MSSALSSLATAAGVSNLAASVLFGAAGPVSVGNVVLSGFEVPESIAWGGAQLGRMHKLPGGVRVFDAMGHDEMPLRWSGHFLSIDAQDRAMQLDSLRRSGQQIDVCWGTFLYSGVVTAFEADFRFSSHIPYRIEISVIEDRSQPAPPSILSVGVQIASDLNGAYGNVAAISATPGLAGSVATALTAIAGAQTAAGATSFVLGSGAYQGAVTALEGAQTAVGSALSAAGLSLGTIAGNAPTGGLVGSVTDLASAASVSGTAAMLASGAAYVGRSLANAVAGAI